MRLVDRILSGVRGLGPIRVASLLLYMSMSSTAAADIPDHGFGGRRPDYRFELLEPLFIASRGIDHRPDGRLVFTHQRGSLSFGVATVSATWRTSGRRLPAMSVQAKRLLSQDALSEVLSRKVFASQQKAAVLVFTGFGMTHSENLELAGALNVVMRCSLPMIVYSPPTEGFKYWPPNYFRDLDKFEWALLVGHVKSALLVVLQSDQVQHLYIVGHSLGARLISGAVAQLMRSPHAHLLSKIKLISLAAPDLTATSFDVQLLPAIYAYRIPTTVYFNAEDSALWWAGSFFSEPRIGTMGKGGLFLRDGVTVIDASEVDVHPFNHLDLAGNRIGADLHYAVCAQLPPERRQLERAQFNGKVYYRMRH